jgi:uncharacterized membrane protein YagU involved in acid resistance
MRSVATFKACDPERPMKSKRRSLLLDIVLGALAGAASTWVMDQVTTILYEQEPRSIRNREDSVRGAKSAYEIAAEKGARLVRKKISAEQRKLIGAAIHWSLGVSSGAIYGALRNRMDTLRLGSGVVYGAAFWLTMDEGALTALGLTRPPQDFPWQTHARGLAGHLVLGAVVEAPFDIIDLVANWGTAFGAPDRIDRHQDLSF